MGFADLASTPLQSSGLPTPLPLWLWLRRVATFELRYFVQIFLSAQSWKGSFSSRVHRQETQQKEPEDFGQGRSNDGPGRS